MIKTNYELTCFINNFIETSLYGPDEIIQDKNKYFAMYIYILYKIFNVKRDYCKELMAIYCNEFISYPPSGLNPVGVFNDIADTVVEFESAFRKEDLPNYLDKEDYLKSTLSSISENMSRLAHAPASENAIMAGIVKFIEDTSLILESIKAASTSHSRTSASVLS